MITYRTSRRSLLLAAFALGHIFVSPCAAFTTSRSSLESLARLQSGVVKNTSYNSRGQNIILRASMASSSDDLYGIPNSGWTTPQWNWGYANGTGHDCAAICRRKFGTRQARADLVETLLNPAADADDDAQAQQHDPPFEEVKLILALAWQKGRWDGSDGGPGGYGAVLAAMADAKRYETEGSKDSRAATLVEDMRTRFHLLHPTEEEEELMKSIDIGGGSDLDAARRICSGLVLKAMGFIEKGL